MRRKQLNRKSPAWYDTSLESIIAGYQVEKRETRKAWVDVNPDLSYIGGERHFQQIGTKHDNMREREGRGTPTKIIMQLANNERPLGTAVEGGFSMSSASNEPPNLALDHWEHWSALDLSLALLRQNIHPHISTTDLLPAHHYNSRANPPKREHKKKFRK